MAKGMIPGPTRSGTTIQAPMKGHVGREPHTAVHLHSLPKTEKERGITKTKSVPNASFVWALSSRSGLPAHSVWYREDLPLFKAHLESRGIRFEDWARANPRWSTMVFGV